MSEDVHLNKAPLDMLNKQRSIDVWPGCVRQPQCSVNTCQNGGQCIDQWTSYSCQCKRPFVGKLCEHRIVEATFGHENESSVVEYSLNAQDASLILMNTDISFLVRTKAKRATIFYLGNKEEDELATFLGAQIDQGCLKVNTRLGGNKVYSSKSATRIDDNKPHLVEISRLENEILIKIDSVTQPSIKVDRPFAHPLLADQLLIGGVGTDGKSVDPPSFKGSLQDMRVNGQLVSLIGSPPPRHSNSAGSISDDVCTQLDPCSSNGTCSNTFNDFVCQCKAGWMGKLCDEQDFCSEADRCPPATTCVNSNKGFVCISTATFAGTSSIKYAVHLPPSQTPLKQNNISFEVRTRTANSALLKLLRIPAFGAEEQPCGSVYSTSQVLFPNLQWSHLTPGQWSMASDWAGGEESEGVLVLDNTTPLPIAIPFSLKKFVLDRNSQIIFGKTGNMTSFKGCLRNATLGSLPPLSFLSKEHSMDSLANTAHFAAAARNNIRSDGCHSDEVCGRMNECKNRAVCVDEFNQRSCQCPAGFEGPLCELNIDDCKTSDGTTRCGPHSVCVDGIHSYSCQCANGFSGEHCDVVEDLCVAKSPCLNGGKCAMLDADYQCTCPAQCMGRNCQVEKVIFKKN
uniref:Uncharacterized protein n=1 Tax=Ditylenchus dipsaci TaxID=166011 RepID=A0A915E4J3_9BILA